jgi:hypothetical protein
MRPEEFEFIGIGFHSTAKILLACISIANIFDFIDFYHFASFINSFHSPKLDQFIELLLTMVPTNIILAFKMIENSVNSSEYYPDFLSQHLLLSEIHIHHFQKLPIACMSYKFTHFIKCCYFSCFLSSSPSFYS